MKKNPFKEIASHKDEPPEIKKKVMREIASIGLLVDFADLFTVKLASLIEEVFSSKKRNQ